MIQTTKLKKKFNDEGIQLPTMTIMMLDSEIERLIDRWVHNAKESNIRRLTPELVWAALGRWSYHQWEK
jgi:hypothetical protein